MNNYSGQDRRRMTGKEFQHLQEKAHADRIAVAKEKRKASTQKRKKPSGNKMRPTLTIALRDRITDIVEARTPDAKEMSFEEKAYYLKRIMTNFKNNFYDSHPNKEKYCESNDLEYEINFKRHIDTGGLFREFERLEAALAELDGEVA